MDESHQQNDSTASRDSLSQRIKQAATDAGFALSGIAPAVNPTGFHPLLEWMEQGYHADMDWMPRRREAYRHPEHVQPEVRSVIMVAMNYHNQAEQTQGSARISRYAWGQSDYHTVLRNHLKTVAGVIHKHAANARTRTVVDTAPLLERDFARMAGVGWFGKNTMLISRNIGSWFFLAALLTNIELEYDQPVETDYCGSCDRCLQACPTDAFPEPGVLDANRCISYLTIERRDKTVPESLRHSIGDWLFGCDVCQEVCPWNRFAPDHSDPIFGLLTQWQDLDPVRLLSITDAEFDELFGDTPMHRTGRAAIVRNAIIVTVNQSRTDACAVLRKCRTDTEPLIRTTAAWALAELGDTQLPPDD